MIIHKCDSCGHPGISELFFCPVCRGDRFSDLEGGEAKVVASLQLYATASPFPDVYFVNLVETGGAKMFCRSAEKLDEGATVRITANADGIVCG